MIAILVLSLFQEVIITLEDGKVMSGHLHGYREGKYLIYDGSQIQVIDESRIKDVVIIKIDGKGPEEAKQPEDDIEKILFERKDYQKAITILHKMKNQGKSLDGLLPYLKIAHFEYIGELIKSELSSQLEAELEFIRKELPHKETMELYEHCYIYFKEYTSKFKSLRFTAEFARIISKHVLENGLLKDKQGEFESELIDLAESKTRLQQYSQTRSIYEILYNINKNKYGPKLADATLLEVSTLILEKNYQHAELIAQKAAGIGIKDERLVDLYEKAKFENLKSKVSLMPKVERLQALEAFKRGCTRQEFLNWIDQEIYRIQKNTTDTVKAVKDITLYYPAEPKRWYKYKYAQGDITEHVTIDSVQKENGTLKVYISQERTFKSHKYPVEVSRKEITSEGLFNIIGSERTPLIMLPIQIGGSWSQERGSQKIKRTVLSVSQTIKTSAGTFEDCLAVEVKTVADMNGSSTTVTAIEYYAPNVGLVKMEILEQAFAKYSIELIEYGKKN